MGFYSKKIFSEAEEWLQKHWRPSPKQDPKPEPPNPSNRSLQLTEADKASCRKRLITIDQPVQPKEVFNRTIHQDFFEVAAHLPSGFVDLAFVDPPYNLNKIFGRQPFKAMKPDDYETWIRSWLPELVRLLKPTASLYFCGTWESAGAICNAAKDCLLLQNRITFEREKGRGAKNNWKQTSEDVWFFTKSKNYVFNVDAVKMRRRVLAPYRDEKGKAKDWKNNSEGVPHRLTHPSNLWTDLTIPFWSMKENTIHPTQKPEKLLAKIILASSKAGDLVFDPFLGSGTTSVVAKKLGRQFVGVELDLDYACLAEKRLALANNDKSIQGFVDGVFWERNSTTDQKKRKTAAKRKTSKR